MIELQRIAPQAAAQALRGCAGLDPLGMVQEGDIPGLCERGECLRLHSGDSSAVLVMHTNEGHVWIEAIKGEGGGLIEATARALELAGARSVAFQTARPGLRRQAERLGYRVTGWVMRKDFE